MMLMLTLLAAAPMVLEPDAHGLPRLQPRAVFDGANESSALLAIDDDPATAWRPDSKHTVLNWVGPGVEGVKSVTLFVRSGCQDSKASFAAWARPRHLVVGPSAVRLSRLHMMPPMREPFEDDSAELELADVMGWQAVTLPARLAGRFAVRVKDSYAGAVHAEPCLTDLRVHVDATGRVDAGEEQLAFDAMKRAISEQLTRAAAAPKRIPAAFDSAELSGETDAPKTELSLQSPDTYANLVKGSRRVAAALRSTWRTPVSQLEAAGWQRASLDFVARDDAALEQGLRGRERFTDRADALLSCSDFKLVAAPSPLAGLNAKLKALAKLADRPMECRAACLPIFAATSVSALDVREDCSSLCSHADEPGEAKLDVGGSGIFVKGGLESPKQVLIVSSRERGEREVMRRQERQLLVYENGRVAAVAMVTWSPSYVETVQLRWSDDRESVQTAVRITFDQHDVTEALRFDAKAEHAERELDPDESLAFDVQR